MAFCPVSVRLIILAAPHGACCGAAVVQRKKGVDLLQPFLGADMCQMDGKHPQRAKRGDDARL